MAVSPGSVHNERTVSYWMKMYCTVVLGCSILLLNGTAGAALRSRRERDIQDVVPYWSAAAENEGLRHLLRQKRDGGASGGGRGSFGGSFASAEGGAYATGMSSTGNAMLIQALIAALQQTTTTAAPAAEGGDPPPASANSGAAPNTAALINSLLPLLLNPYGGGGYGGGFRSNERE